jgi:hypothetical protein
MTLIIYVPTRCKDEFDNYNLTFGGFYFLYISKEIYCLSYISVVDIIPDPNFFPSRIRIFFHPGSSSKNLSILTQIIVSKLLEICSGLFIADPDPDFYLSRIHGSKRHPPDPGSGSATHCFKYDRLFVFRSRRLSRRRRRCISSRIRRTRSSST